MLIKNEYVYQFLNQKKKLNEVIVKIKNIVTDGTKIHDNSTSAVLYKNLCIFYLFANNIILL